MLSSFDGFPIAGFRFLKQLKKNNDRDWFREHKAEYQNYVERPMEALVVSLAERCRAAQVPLYAKERNPVMRVYRDVRFSKDKSPFKTHVAAELRRSFHNSTAMVYLHLSPEESLIAAGVWQPDRPALQAWRTTIIAEPKRFESAVSRLKKNGLELMAEHSLTVMPRGLQSYGDQAIAPWLKLTSFIVRRPLQQVECTNAKLLEIALQFVVAAKPLLEFAWHVESTMPRPVEHSMEEAFFGKPKGLR